MALSKEIMKRKAEQEALSKKYPIENLDKGLRAALQFCDELDQHEMTNISLAWAWPYQVFGRLGDFSFHRKGDDDPHYKDFYQMGHCLPLALAEEFDKLFDGILYDKRDIAPARGPLWQLGINNYTNPGNPVVCGWLVTSKGLSLFIEKLKEHKLM